VNLRPFEIIKTSGLARRGRLTLKHGQIETPVFMPVGTYGAVKTMTPKDLESLDTQILLGNTYHLYLRPGLETLSQFGGLHSWMKWSKPILTDSGGFQVFSLDAFKKMSDEGVEFRSHLNGDKIFLTPELCSDIQRTIGSDIAMVLDECVSLPNTEAVLDGAVVRSVAWAKRFLAHATKKDPIGQKIFGIVQGGTSLALRQKSLELTSELAIDGMAIGGLSVGETHEEMVEILQFLGPQLPAELPHYLMGVGTPRDILEAVNQGVDMFDCVLPTRNGRNGGFFTHEGLLNIRNQKYQRQEAPIDVNCSCYCCQNFSASYLRHLFQIKEILGK
jgi:queuine tRNA-ribosyltransferase